MMNTKMIPVPTPAEYLDQLVSDIHYNMTKDFTNGSRQLAEKVLGVRIQRFGELEISSQKLDYIISKLDPELLKKTDDNIVKQIEANLKKSVSKAFLTRLTDDIRYKIYARLEEQLYNTLSDYITKKVEDQIIPEIDKYFSTWKVAAQLVDVNEKK